jgi:hypothetical protein
MKPSHSRVRFFLSFHPDISYMYRSSKDLLKPISSKLKLSSSTTNDMNPSGLAVHPTDSSHSNLSEDQLQLDTAVLQSVSESVAALFPRCFALTSKPCACFFCKSNAPASSNSAVANQNVALPPPSRYVRRARYSSPPPKGPSPMSNVSHNAAPICGGPTDASDDFIQ